MQDRESELPRKSILRTSVNKGKWRGRGCKTSTLRMLLGDAALAHNSRPYGHPSPSVAGPIGAGPALARTTELC
jgi:hypothetical protein